MHFMEVILLLIALSLSIINNANGQMNASIQKPNILFIAVDDLNDWAGFLGGHPGMKIHTPNIDRFAASSMIFTNAHTPAPACAPARAAILTGVHHARMYTGAMGQSGENLKL